MKLKFLENKKNLSLNPVSDTFYVLVPKGKVDIKLTMKKKRVSVRLLILYTAKGDKSVNLSTTITHKVPDTRCVVSVKGVLFDKSKSDFEGKIVIEKKAGQVTSLLSDKVLFVGKDVKNTSKPILEISSNDVKASHQASSGAIDKDQLYYLTSRGLSKKEAQDVIVRGFFEPDILDIKDERVIKVVRKKLNV